MNRQKSVENDCKNERSDEQYKWLVCLGCALVFFCTCGVALNVYTVYSPFLIELYGFSKTQIAILSSFRSVINILSLCMIGIYYRHIPVKTGLLIGSLMSVIGYVVFSFSGNHYGGYLLGNAFLGIGFGLTPLMALSMVLDHWFPLRREAALGICSAASGASSLGLPMILTASARKNGLSRTFLYESFFMLAITAIAAFLIKESPGANRDAGKKNIVKADDEAGEMNIGCTAPDREDSAVSAASISSLSDAFRNRRSIFGTPYLYLAYAMMIMAGGVCGTGFSNISLLASTQGYSDSQMAMAVTLLGTLFMVGKCLFGICSDRFSIRKATILFSIILLTGDILCCISGSSIIVMYMGASIFGLSVSVIAVGVVSWTEDWSDSLHRSRLKQMFQIMYTVGCLLFGFLVGVIADVSGGSYVPAYLLLTIMEGMVFIIILRIYRFVNK